MFFSVLDLLGWSFQMFETESVQISPYHERTSPAFVGMSQGELRCMAVDVLAKVGRLPADEQAVLTAYFLGSAKSIKQSALLVLPKGWPMPLKLELVRRWLGKGIRSQQLMAESYRLSQQTISRRIADACERLNAVLRRGCAVLELQLADLLKQRLVHAEVL